MNYWHMLAYIILFVIYAWTVIFLISIFVLQRIYSRIARVCKNDPGGQTLMRDTWTTFSKSRLNCSLPGEFPFYYDEIQGAVYHPEEGTVYATLTTPKYESYIFILLFYKWSNDNYHLLKSNFYQHN